MNSFPLKNLKALYSTPSKEKPLNLVLKEVYETFSFFTTIATIIELLLAETDMKSLMPDG